MQMITERFIEFYNYGTENKLFKNDAELARKLGVTAPAISNLLAGTSKASLKIAQGIAKSFTMVNISWFLTGSGNMIEESRVAIDKKEKAPMEDRLANIEAYIKGLDTKVSSNVSSIYKGQELMVERIERIEESLGQFVDLLRKLTVKQTS